jgi:cholesterol transport system auxiliary component
MMPSPTAFRLPPVSAALRLAQKGRLALLLCATLLAGCSGGSASRTFDLTAPRDAGRIGGGSRAALVVAEPSTVQVFDSERIIVRDQGGGLSTLPGGQWADRLPRLVQTRLIQTFENASRLGAVARPGERVLPDWQLNLDIRNFTIESGTGEAVVEISAKLVRDRTGRVQGARLFTARVPVGAIDPENAAQALDRALSQVLVDIVRWARV